MTIYKLILRLLKLAVKALEKEAAAQDKSAVRKTDLACKVFKQSADLREQSAKALKLGGKIKGLTE